MKKKHTGEKNE